MEVSMNLDVLKLPIGGLQRDRGFFGGYLFPPLEKVTGGYEDARAYESGRGSDEDETGRTL